MRKLAALCALALLYVAPAHATSTRSQLSSYFSGATGSASSTNCWPTNGVGSITATTMRACMIEFLAAVPWIYGDVTSVAAVGVATPYNWNWPTTAGTAGQVLTSAGGGAGTMTWGNAGAGTISEIDQGNGIVLTPSPIVATGSVAVNEAANADVWAGTQHKIIDTRVAQTSLAEVALTISTSTFTPDFSAGINERITLIHASCPCVIASPTVPRGGLSGNLRIIQSSTGSDTVTWGGNWKFAGGSAPTLSTSANAIDVLPYYCWDTTHCVVTLVGNVQ